MVLLGSRSCELGIDCLISFVICVLDWPSPNMHQILVGEGSVVCVASFLGAFCSSPDLVFFAGSLG
jgi:hypothetical protein